MNLSFMSSIPKSISQVPSIPNALEHISQACNDRLLQLFPAGIPAAVKERYDLEFKYLSSSDYIDDFELFRLFSDESRKNSTFLSAKSTTSGSFIYYLLSNGSFNPLPAYYYCPHCGHYESAPSHMFGIDLPPIICPVCRKEISPSGFNLPLESVWGNDGKKSIDFTHRTSSEFLSFARHILTNAYPDNEIVPLGIFQIAPTSGNTFYDSGVIGVIHSGYAILPEGTQLSDYPNLISCLEDGTPCVTINDLDLSQHPLKIVNLKPDNNIDSLINLQRATGLYVSEISEENLRPITWNFMCNSTVMKQNEMNLFQQYSPKTFYNMVGLEAALHNSYIWQDHTVSGTDDFKFYKMVSSDFFSKNPCFTREDFFEYLIDNGMERSLAFTASEYIRKGKMAIDNPLHGLNLPFSLPSEIKEIAQNYHYVFPRACAVDIILTYAKFTYYAQTDSIAYSKVKFNKFPLFNLLQP